MANRKNTFLIKRSNVAGKVPAAGDLQLGELALNTADNILYASGTTANSILPIGWDRVARTGDTMTGSLFAPSISATTISATTYLNLPSMAGDFLPLSGGTVYGPTSYTGGLTADTLNVTGLTQTSGITSTGGITFKQVTINGSYTATTSDYMIDITGGTFTVSLPSAVGIQGRLLVVKNNGGGAVTVDPYDNETIDGKSFVILGETNSIQLASNGTEWIALGYNISTVNSSTGVFEFTGLTKVTSTTFRVAEVKGWIVDDTTNPLSPQLYYIYYSGGVHTDNYVTTTNETFVYLTSGGTIAQQSTPLTTTQRRLNIFLGKLGHPDKTTINLVFSQPDFVLSPLAQLRDMFQPINLINGGVYPSPNTGLTINTNAGYIYGLGINFASDTLNPNSLYIPGTNPLTFQYRTQTGGTITNRTNIDPLNYDLNGVITPIGGTKATNQRIYLLQNGTFRVQYGQHQYSNFADAVQALQTETFTPFPNFVNNAVLIGVLTLLSTATDLTDESKAKFFFASKFGETIGAAGGVSTTTLQQAYNNSTNPEIVINATLDGLSIQNGTGNADNTTKLIEGLNTAGNTTSFIRADGYISGTTFQSNGFRANNDGVTATTVSATTVVTNNLTVTGGTQSWFSGNSSSDLVRITQTGSGNALVVEDETNPDSTPFVVDASGNIGVGLTTPSNKLHIRTATDQNIGFTNGVSGSLISSFNNAASANVNLSFDASAYKYHINGVEKVTIDSSGNLGIGVTSPSAKLHVGGNTIITGNTYISGSSTTVGDVTGFSLISTQSSGNEGGEVRLATSQTGSLSGGNITFDVYQNRLRFFESGGSNRGVYIDLTAAATGVGTNLLSGGGGEINTASNLGSGTGLFAQKVAADLQFKSLTSTGGTVTISNNSTTVNLEVVPASNFTGGTVTGPTSFTNGLTANTFSATTYLNLPTDIRVTGGTYSNGTSIFTNNTGGTFNVTGYYTGGTDVFVTGGTYSNGSLSFVNNTGGTFNILTSTNYAAGVISGATYSSAGSGQINLPAIKVALYNNETNIEPIIVYDVASGTTGTGGIPSLVDQDTNYVVVEYNGGSPRYYVYDNDGPVNDSSVVLFMIVYRAGNFVHTLEFGNQGAGLANKLNDRFIMTDRFGYESGLALSLSADTGIVMLSSGVAWNGPNRQTLTAVDSSGSTFFKNYHSGGTWTYTTTGKTINNTYYDNGTDIVLATAGKYLTNWYFRGQETNGHLYEVYSPNQYDSVALAQLSTEPALPELITSHAILVGRIIVGVNATTGLTESAFVNTFQSTNVTAHNDLSGLQGGTAGQYYHLTSNQYNNLALTNIDNLFSVSQTFNSGLISSTVSATTYQNLPFTGTTNYLPKWTSSNGLGNSQIRDDGTNIGIGMVPTTNNKFSIVTFSDNYFGLWVRNASNISGAKGIYGISDGSVGTQTGVWGIGQGHPTTGTSIGVDGGATDGLLGIGVRGTVGPSEFGSMVTGIGGYFDGRGDGGYGYPTNSYSVQLLDGTEGIDKVLVSKTVDGKANWSSDLTGLTSVNATTVSATTLIGDGSQITNITATVPYGIINAIASGNFLT